LSHNIGNSAQFLESTLAAGEAGPSDVVVVAPGTRHLAWYPTALLEEFSREVIL
jgi:hypothetical protein